MSYKNIDKKMKWQEILGFTFVILSYILLILRILKIV
jgi:hypothetical protein